MHILPPSQDERMARGKDGFGFRTIYPSIHPSQAILDTESMARSIILRLCARVKFSALSADINSITADRACWSTCIALTAPQLADIEESLSNVTELGKFCTITLSIRTGGAAALGGAFCWGDIVIEVREGEGLCKIGTGPRLPCLGPPWLFPWRIMGWPVPW